MVEWIIPSCIVLILMLILAAAQIMHEANKCEKLKREKDCALLNYEQLKQKHEFCMEFVLHKAASVVVVVNRAQRARNNGKRSKWTVDDMQSLSSDAFGMLELVEDNAHHVEQN